MKHVTLQKDGNNTYWRGLLDGWGERSNSWRTSCVPLVWHTSQTVRGGSAWYQHSDLFKINIIAWKCWILNIEHVWIYIGFQINSVYIISGVYWDLRLSVYSGYLFFSLFSVTCYSQQIGFLLSVVVQLDCGPCHGVEALKIKYKHIWMHFFKKKTLTFMPF